MPFLDNAPTPVKAAVAIVIFSGFIGINFFFAHREKQVKKHFYKNGFASTVVKSNEYAYQSRFIEFHLKNDQKIYLSRLVDRNLQIGDSIQKTANTFIYKVYRKDPQGQYGYFATYDWSKWD